MAELLGSDAAWKEWGVNDPYYAVCTRQQYRRGQLDEEGRRAFFRVGEKRVAHWLRTIRRRVERKFCPVRALDFGCGVGRLTLPLARLCERAVGVDISEGMLVEAQRNAAACGMVNVDWVMSDDELRHVWGSFNLVCSHNVFQHIPPQRGLRILRALLDRLEERGVGVLHMTYGRTASRWQKAIHAARRRLPLIHGLLNLARGKPMAEPLMEMNAYDLNQVLAVLQGAGAGEMHAEFTDHGGHLGVVLYFQKGMGARRKVVE